MAHTLIVNGGWGQRFPEGCDNNFQVWLWLVCAVQPQKLIEIVTDNI